MPDKREQAAEIALNLKILEKSRQLTDKALNKIEQLSLKSSPQFYELWYRYFDKDPELVRAIESYEGEIDDKACQEIYDKYLSANMHNNTVLEANNQVQDFISDLTETLESVRISTSEYGESLGDMTKDLPEDMSVEDMRNLVASMLGDTKKMAEKNQALEAQLDNSSKEVMELKKDLEIVKKEITIDELTGILNRRAFDEQIAVDVKETEINKTPLVLLMIDIDFFKKFNDSYGRPIGDQVLCLIARTLTDNIKEHDTVARYGGEKFTVLLPSTGIKEGYQIAEMLRQKVANKELISKSKNKNFEAITISIGVAEHRAAEDPVSFIKRTNLALLKAKEGGRNCVQKA